MRALIVEPQKDAAELLTKVLQPLGRVERAAHGEQAIRKVCDGLRCGRGYDVVCLGLGLPDMDGLFATRRIRAVERAGGRRTARIVILSPAGCGAWIRPALQAHVDAWLSKPAMIDGLAAASTASLRTLPGLLMEWFPVVA